MRFPVLNKFYTMLGFAAKARRLVSGETGSLSAIGRGRSRLTIVASDASVNTVNRFTSRCRSAGCRLVRVGEAQELGRAIGKSPRSAIVILDEGFARTLLEMLGEITDMR